VIEIHKPNFHDFEPNEASKADNLLENELFGPNQGAYRLFWCKKLHLE
jgi:hypothetical protein